LEEHENLKASARPKRKAGPAFAGVLFVYISLLLARAPWVPIDFIFDPALHLYIAGVPLLIALFAFYNAFSVLRLGGKIVQPGGGDAAGAAVAWIFNSTDAVKRLLIGIFSLYCLTLLVAALSLNPALGIYLWAVAEIAGETMRWLSGRKLHFLIGVEMVAAGSTAAAALGIRFIAGVPLSAYPLAAFALFVIIACFFPALFPTMRMSTIWKNTVDNKFSCIAVSMLLFVMYYTYVPSLNKARPAPPIESRISVGGGAGIAPTSDGRFIVYLNKKHKSVDLIDRETLEIVRSVGVRAYPRQIAYDREKKLFYVAVHGKRYRQLEIISESPFASAGGVSLPSRYCSQANAVNVDYGRNKILVGCDDSGRLYLIDRDTLAAPREPMEKGPKGKGMVRIEIDEKTDRAFTFGCFLGPFINEIDLVKGRLSRSKLTGYLVWETVFDARSGRLFLGVPFRSIVAVVSEKTLRVERVIRSGFGARALAIDRKGNRLFIGSQIASVVDVYDLDSLKLKRRFYLPFPRYFYYDEREGALYVAGTAGLYKVRI